ncbi:hypothetical protein EV681_2670 [Advenella incenata]|uniref:Uncharacterized protein n=1 Tax=Advenella incenata TaxID=267800 RepID=A0A4Q7VFC3_9BURK|nr:hypothetical protein [Advenella incenata]RZT94252.1 hypothetical protein EV681_2670 [Advenella incenata]
MKISIDYKRGSANFTANVHDESGSENDEYAFYLMRKGGSLPPVKVAVSWYSCKISHTFVLPALKGHYYIICFRKESARSGQQRVVSEVVHVENFSDYTKADGIFFYSNEEQFFATEIFESGTHYVTRETATLAFKVVNKKTDTCFVSLAAAAKRDGGNEPIFTGLGLSRKMKSSSILVSDPSLHSDPTLTLAWYAGNKNLRLQVDLPRFVNHIVYAIGACRTILFGSSGGGFATLFYSNRLINCIGISVNPQVDIARFHAHLVRDYLKAAFNHNNLEVPLDSALQACGIEHNIVPLFKRLKFLPKTFYLQNRNDWHYEEHLMYFLRSLGVSDECDLKGVGLYESNLYTLVSPNWGDGHVAPPKELIIGLINELEENASYWEANGFDVNRKRVSILLKNH